MSDTHEVFLGWDVGGWNCDKNPTSRDALCALVMQDGGLVAARPWRGNLRDVLVTRVGDALVSELLNLAGAPPAERVTLAIDATLGWPRAMLDLVEHGRLAEVPRSADANPYLFRAQDRDLFGAGSRPLSPVRDMIGSQSTKAMHFLRAAHLERHEPGVWSSARVTAIETYPAPAREHPHVRELTASIHAQIAKHGPQLRAMWLADARDAGTCAIVAWLFATQRDALAPPTGETDPAEGWIWLPRHG